MLLGLDTIQADGEVMNTLAHLKPNNVLTTMPIETDCWVFVGPYPVEHLDIIWWCALAKLVDSPMPAPPTPQL